MSWLKIDDGFHCHPKILDAGNAATGLFVRLASYCSDQLTDGLIPAAVMRMYSSTAETRRLTTVGLIVSEGKDYRIPDYLDFNPSAATVHAQRVDQHDAKVRAGQAGGYASGEARRKQKASTDKAECLKQNEAPSRPDPIEHGCTESSVSQTARLLDDDDDFSTAIDAIVAAKEAANPPKSNPHRWRQVTRANTVAEYGQGVKDLLDAGKSTTQIAQALTLGEYLADEARVPRARHPDDCQKCDQGSVEVVDNQGVTRYQPCSERIVAP